MKTLIIYDTTGYIYFQMSGAYRIPEGGLNYSEVDIPEGKMVTSIDVSKTPNIPVFTDIPKTVTEERIQAVEDSNAELMAIVASLTTTS